MTRYFLINGEKATDLGLHESKPVLAANKGTVYEAVFAEQPAYNPETQKLIETWSVKWAKYRQEFEVVDKTPLEMWPYPEWAKRIIAPAQLVFTDDGAKMHNWFQLMGFPIVRKGGLIEVYFEEVLPEHQAVVDSLQGIITIEDRPAA